MEYLSPLFITESCCKYSLLFQSGVIMSSIAFQELERLKMEQARDVAELMRKKKAIMEEKTTDTQTKAVEDDR